MKDGFPESNYITALLDDLRLDVEFFEIDRKIKTIFIGGGTPSLFSPESFERLLTGISEQLVFQKNIEITLEANPSTFESAKFKEFRDLGINRLSIGVQSFHNHHLKKLGRVHDASEAFKAAEIVKEANFDNFNLDLMFGLPNQTQIEALLDVQNAIALNPTHISFYQLTLEPNTYFYSHPPTLPKDELIFDLQKKSQQLLFENGFNQYEISAYSKKGFQCQHNLNYWTFGDYLGIGAGAHGKITQNLPDKINRTRKRKNPSAYLSDKTRLSEPIISAELPLEFMMNQLRLKQFFSVEDYQNKTGLPASTLEPALSIAIEEKLIVQLKEKYFCTERGWNFLDNILEKFIS